MRIRFVNHASFVCESDGTQLICDPWLAGSAFNDGWDLIVPSQFLAENWKKIDFIWLSHEHPDHFSPRSLARVPEELRSNIVVLYQATVDGKVLRACEKLGFATRELPDDRLTRLTPSLSVRCGRVPLFDSWLLLDSGKQKILNLNDCALDSRWALRRLRAKLGSIDVLFSQFSYAAWRGNREAGALRKKDAADKLLLLHKQVQELQPRFAVPFASFCFFSHEENFFTNDHANRPLAALNAIAETGVQPVLLYPGDEWQVEEEPLPDNQLALGRYAAAWSTLPARARRTSPVATLEQLKTAAQAYIRRVESDNHRVLLIGLKRLPWLTLLRPLDICLWDWNRSVCFSFEQGLDLKENASRDYELRMSSNSLLFLLRYPWGLDTLTVNGRFEANAAGLQRLVGTFGVGALNNAGLRVAPSLLLEGRSLAFIAKIVGRKLWRMSRAPSADVRQQTR